MKTAIVAAVCAATMASTAMAAEDFTYNMITGQLPGTDIIAAEVVREPVFAGEKDEQVQAMDQAKAKLDAEYCGSRGGEFVVDQGLIVFDRGTGMWMVGGVCK